MRSVWGQPNTTIFTCHSVPHPKDLVWHDTWKVLKRNLLRMADLPTFLSPITTRRRRSPSWRTCQTEVEILLSGKYCEVNSISPGPYQATCVKLLSVKTTTDSRGHLWWKCPSQVFWSLQSTFWKHLWWESPSHLHNKTSWKWGY